MIYIFGFLFNFYKRRYAKALACLPVGCGRHVAMRHHALYRLGMYRSLARETPVDGDLHSLFAIAVSAAACGDRAKAEDLLSRFSALKRSRPSLESLCAALLTFYPDLSHRFLPNSSKPSLKMATLLRQKKISEALAICRQAQIDGSPDPELHLLYSNALRPSPAESLACLNKFLTSYGLHEVDLQSADFPPSALNIKSLQRNEAVQGPLVSVVMTAFRSAGRIISAIESLLSQTYKNIEVIVVDDASDDDTESLLLSFAQDNPRVRYIRLPVNVGTYVAKSIGARLAKGEFVTCQDSDDWAHPQKIALQVKPLLLDKHVVFTTSNLVRMQDDGVYFARAVYPLSRLNSSSVLFRKDEVMERAGLWDLVRTGADSEFLARLKLVFGERGMVRLSTPLSFCAHRENSLMTASSTGYDENGVSGVRLDYWEEFSRWHIDCLARSVLPKMSEARTSGRFFPAPDDILVPLEDVGRCMNAMGLRKI